MHAGRQSSGASPRPCARAAYPPPQEPAAPPAAGSARPPPRLQLMHVLPGGGSPESGVLSIPNGPAFFPSAHSGWEHIIFPNDALDGTALGSDVVWTSSPEPTPANLLRPTGPCAVVSRRTVVLSCGLSSVFTEHHFAPRQLAKYGVHLWYLADILSKMNKLCLSCQEKHQLSVVNGKIQAFKKNQNCGKLVSALNMTAPQFHVRTLVRLTVP